MPARHTASVQAHPVPPRAIAPFDVLDQCHQQIMLALGRMDDLLVHLEQHGVDGRTRELARDIFMFFNLTARLHHQDEEQHVFPPLLVSSDDELVRQVLRLQQDHCWIEEDWRELAPQFEAIAAGYNWYNPEQLALAIPTFKALYHDHIALEESMVYPEAKARIAAWELQGMGREMALRRRQANPHTRAA
jgi:hemerythrin-like domain-containing protein